jgi:Fic family protein
LNLSTSPRSHASDRIHPFPDGNGQIGRILNVLYLTRAGLLEIPILYLSRHITRTKADYYRLLQAVRFDGAWEDWVLYILEAVAVTAQTTLALVEGIRSQVASVKKRLRDELHNVYSQDLLNNLFRHRYTRIEFVVNDLTVSRQTAAKYLDCLAEKGFLAKHRSSRSNYYVNADLVRRFLEVSGENHAAPRSA